MLQVDDLDLVPQLPRVAVDLSGVDHQPGIVRSGSGHHPFPQDTAGAIPDDLEGLLPVWVWDEVTQGSFLWSRHERLVGSLAIVIEDRLPAVTPVDVAEDVKLRPHSPDLVQKTSAAQVEVHVVALDGLPIR